MPRSVQEQAAVTCPRCGQPFVAPVWLVLDRTEHPDLVHLLLDGELNVAHCPACGAEGGLNHPLLFHDPAARQVICALPLSVADQDEARRIVGDLVQRLVDAVPAAERAPYLGEVEIVPELDGLRTRLIEQSLATDSASHDRLIALAVGELLNVTGEADFRRVIAEHRALLLSDRAERAFDDLLVGARRDDDRELQRRIREAKAVLGRFRATLRHRRDTLNALLARLSPLSDGEAHLLPQLRTMLGALDPQEVYAARIAVPPAQRDVLDGLIARLIDLARQSGEHDGLAFLQNLQSLPLQ